MSTTNNPKNPSPEGTDKPGIGSQTNWTCPEEIIRLGSIGGGPLGVAAGTINGGNIIQENYGPSSLLSKDDDGVQESKKD